MNKIIAIQFISHRSEIKSALNNRNIAAFCNALILFTFYSVFTIIQLGVSNKIKIQKEESKNILDFNVE